VVSKLGSLRLEVETRAPNCSNFFFTNLLSKAKLEIYMSKMRLLGILESICFSHNVDIK
jgi:hypothetical protein